MSMGDWSRRERSWDVAIYAQSKMKDVCIFWSMMETPWWSKMTTMKSGDILALLFPKLGWHKHVKILMFCANYNTSIVKGRNWLIGCCSS